MKEVKQLCEEQHSRQKNTGYAKFLRKDNVWMVPKTPKKYWSRVRRGKEVWERVIGRGLGNMSYSCSWESRGGCVGCVGQGIVHHFLGKARGSSYIFRLVCDSS